MRLQGGMSVDAVEFSEDVREVFLELLPHARLVVELPTEAMRDVRFNYDEGVLWRAETMFIEEEFLKEPLQVINGALIDAARADWYYTHEKDYGREDDSYDEDGDGC